MRKKLFAIVFVDAKTQKVFSAKHLEKVLGISANAFTLDDVYSRMPTLHQVRMEQFHLALSALVTTDDKDSGERFKEQLIRTSFEIDYVITTEELGRGCVKETLDFITVYGSPYFVLYWEPQPKLYREELYIPRHILVESKSKEVDLENVLKRVKTEMKKRYADRIRLSIRRREICNCLLSGQENQRLIAEQLNIQHGTVREHMMAIRALVDKVSAPGLKSHQGLCHFFKGEGLLEH